MYAHIALPLPLDDIFTYLVPEEMTASAEPGRRALVPFGPRILTGFITGISEDPGDIPLSSIKPLHEIIDDEPIFDKHMYDLCKWAADYYICSVGEVLKTAMPYGSMAKSRIIVNLNPDMEDNLDVAGRAGEIIELLRGISGLPLSTLERRAGGKIRKIVKSLEKRGVLTLTREIKPAAVKPKTERYVKLTGDFTGKISKKAHKQRECLQILQKYPEGTPLSELIERYGFSRGIINSIVNSDLALYEDIEVARLSHILKQEDTKVDHTLTEDQKKAISEILTEAGSVSPRPVLLMGVTGSGKTRVYIELAKKMIAIGKGAIILVPEISLTPQTTRFFTSVFPGRVAVIHSAMSPGERFDSWHIIKKGDVDIVIGPRSAIFAPLKNLGIIIVDEEHDSSYKQTDTSPRYNARDLSVVRGNSLGISVVLGSATPSMESWHNVSSGKYILSTLPNRVGEHPLPEIEIINMKDERASGNMSDISSKLRDEIHEKISRAEKCIILINRRGYSSSICCRACGYILTCPDCESGLTFHSTKNLAICHLCGYEQIVMEHCPECGSAKMFFRGRGTQRVEKELENIIGNQQIIRMDSDTTSMHDGHFKLLDEFINGPYPLLVGTQMVSKGLDIHDVTLVGIVSADMSLFLPDFRAFERTFQLISQASGRAGRGKNPGKVIIQTFYPDHYAICSAAMNNFTSFAEIELNSRKELNYPPFSRLILVEMHSENLQELKSSAEKVKEYLAVSSREKAEILGPVEAPIPKVRGKYRIQILIKSGKNIHFKKILRQALKLFSSETDAFYIDVDPIDMI